jgi:hypothetical protein
MIFLGLSVLALAAFALLGLRLWRQATALGADIIEALDRQSGSTAGRE